MLLLSCIKTQSTETPPRTANGVLGTSYSSANNLATAALKAIADSSSSELAALLVTKDIYRDVIWKTLPAEEIGNMSVEMAWEWVARDSEKAIRRILLDYGGKKLTLKRVYEQHETKFYPAMRIIRGLRIVAEDPSGELIDLKLLNVVAEVDGLYKAIAFDT
jgi:hypothetical protein